MSETRKLTPGFDTLGKIGSIVLLNFICMVSCIPLITIGDAAGAMYYVMLKLVRGTEEEVIKPYFRFFIGNFLKSIPYTLALAAGTFVISSAVTVLKEVSGPLAFCTGVSLCIVLAAEAGWAIPLFAQFDDPFGTTLKHAFMLALQNPKETAVVTACNLCLPAVILLVPQVSAYALFFWMFAGAAILSRIAAGVLAPVFERLMPEQKKIEEECSEDE
jgi:uncharacterized membrane protein YesL